MKNKKILLSVIISSLLFALVLIVDIVTKYIMFKVLPTKGSSMSFIPGFINFIHVENTGVAWGALAGRPIFLIVIAITILSLYLTFFILKLKRNKEKPSILLSITAGLLAGGCVGNLYDRIVFGYVRDFINFEFMNFPVFNFADMMICLSVFLMVIYFLFIYPKEDNLYKNKEKIEKNQEKMQKNDKKPSNIENIDENSNNKISKKNDEKEINLSETENKKQDGEEK